jgi:hypothetical protein
MPTLMRKWSVLSLIFPQAQKKVTYIEVAHYYFDQGVTSSTTMVSKVNESQLSATDRDKFNFQKDMQFKNKKRSYSLLK